MNKLTEKYRKFEDDKILQIINNSSNYEQDIVDTAILIANERNLSIPKKKEQKSEHSQREQTNDYSDIFEQIVEKFENLDFIIQKKIIKPTIKYFKLKKNNIIFEVSITTSVNISVKQPMYFTIFIFLLLFPLFIILQGFDFPILLSTFLYGIVGFVISPLIYKKINKNKTPKLEHEIKGILNELKVNFNKDSNDNFIKIMTYSSSSNLHLLHKDLLAMSGIDSHTTKTNDIINPSNQFSELYVKKDDYIEAEKIIKNNNQINKK